MARNEPTTFFGSNWPYPQPYNSSDTNSSIAPPNGGNNQSYRHIQSSVIGNGVASYPSYYVNEMSGAELSQNTSFAPISPKPVSPRSRHLSWPLNPNTSSGTAMSPPATDVLKCERPNGETKKNPVSHQSRRKVQNRAAQRAFRERKEKQLHDLEAKIQLLTSTKSTLHSDNERLETILQKVRAENEKLRAMMPFSRSAPQTPAYVDFPSLPFSRRASAMTARSPVLSPVSNQGSGSSHRYSDSDSGCRPISIAAVWDLMQSHPFYLSGLVDIGEVCERLKTMFRCDDVNGPTIAAEEVLNVISELGNRRTTGSKGFRMPATDHELISQNHQSGGVDATIIEET